MRVIPIAFFAAAVLVVGQSGDARAKRMLLRAQQAMGGLTKLASLKDMVLLGEITFEPTAGGGKVKLTTHWMVPNHLRMEMETSSGRIITYTNGRSGWVAGPQGVEPIPVETVREEAQDELFHELVPLMLSDHDASRTVSAAAENAVRVSTASGHSARVEFDSATGRPARLLYQGHEATTKTAIEVVLTFSDWRPTSGIMMPYRIAQTENGAKALETIVSGYRFNSGLSADALSKKP